MPNQNEIVITPNYASLFSRFLRDAKWAGEHLAQDVAQAHQDGRQDAREHLEHVGALLRVVQGLVAPLTICLQSATSAAEIELLRTVMGDVLSGLDKAAFEAEAKAEALTEGLDGDTQ